MNQLGGARRADHHGLRLEALKGVARGGFEQLRGVAAQVARLEGGVGDRRALGQALNHGEQQVSVGVALRCVQHVMHTFHRGGDAHGTDVRWAFVSPQGELHGQASINSGTAGAGARPPIFKRRSKGRANSSAKSAAWS